MSSYIQLIGESEDRDLVGGKGSSLSIMHNLGLPVPPGFTITTEAWRALQTGGLKFATLWRQIALKMKQTFPAFGKGTLVSVRSGAAQSMPGMLDTILNVGVTPESTPLLRYNFWRSYCLALGVERSVIQEVADQSLMSAGKFFVEELPPAYLNSIIAKLSALATSHGGGVKTHSALLRTAVKLVFDSWDSERAVAYRDQFGISHTLGTACTIQQMADGTRGGSGVYLTRNPDTGEPGPYIDWLKSGQGDSVVDGSAATGSAEQLRADYPVAYRQLLSIGDRLEGVYHDAMDIEFTVDNDQLFILQCRPAKRNSSARPRILLDLALEGKLDKSAVLNFSDEPVVNTAVEIQTATAPFARATPIVPGLVTGQLSLNGSHKPGSILVRNTTSPDDLPAMLKSSAILTVVGGPTCHAALVAREMGIPTFVGLTGCTVYEKTLVSPVGKLKDGDVMTVLPDGRVYAGQVEATEVSSVDPNYTRLMTLKRWLEDKDA